MYITRNHPLLRSDVLGQLSLDVRRWNPGLSESKDDTLATRQRSAVRGYGDRVPNIKRSFLAGAEAFVRPWIDS